MKEKVGNMIATQGANEVKISDGIISEYPELPFVELKDIAIGEIFTTAAGDFIALKHREDGTTEVVSANSITKMAFGDNNDWRESNHRNHLNSEYLAELHTKLGEDNIIKHTVDLLSLDGRKDYGVSEDMVNILTLDQYRKHSKYIIPTIKPGETFSLSTPYSTPSGVGAGGVLFVLSRGDVGWFGCGWDGLGVRPFLNLKSDIFVSKK